MSLPLPVNLPINLPKPFRNTISLATRHEDTPEGVYEIGIDECGRGPMFGRLYAAAVVLPNDNSDNFAHHLMRDSKKITSRARRAEIAQYIRNACVSYSIQYVEHDTIDRVNVLQANMQAMHACVRDIIGNANERLGGQGPTVPTTNNGERLQRSLLFRSVYGTEVAKASYPHERPGGAPGCFATGDLSKEYGGSKYTLLVDGNYFKPCSVVVEEELVYVPYTTIEGGDNRYSAIAAASILAKDAHDTWIETMCDQYPALEERYGMRSHVGYGTRRHLDGIAAHGITQWHRRTFGLCKTAPLNPI